LAKLDLVTRREFEVQSGVLKRTREKLEALEAKLAQFEADAAGKAPRG
jgi:BMFP domain-containing protein YqiC